MSDEPKQQPSLPEGAARAIEMSEWNALTKKRRETPEKMTPTDWKRMTILAGKYEKPASAPTGTEPTDFMQAAIEAGAFTEHANYKPSNDELRSRIRTVCGWEAERKQPGEMYYLAYIMWKVCDVTVRRYRKAARAIINKEYMESKGMLRSRHSANLDLLFNAMVKAGDFKGAAALLKQEGDEEGWNVTRQEISGPDQGPITIIDCPEKQFPTDED